MFDTNGLNLTDRERQLIAMYEASGDERHSRTVDFVDRNSCDEFDLLLCGSQTTMMEASSIPTVTITPKGKTREIHHYKAGPLTTKYSAWLPLGCIYELTLWPELMRASDWSFVRDMDRKELLQRFTEEIAPMLLEENAPPTKWSRSSL